MDAVLTTMVADDLGPGPVAEELVKLLSDYLDAKGGYLTSLWSDAVAMALRALDLEPGSQVVISALSPRCYLDALSAAGLEPEIVDVLEASGCIDPQAAAKALDAGASAILVHYPLGFIPDIEALSETEAPLIEDISCAYGGHDGQRPAGTSGAFTIMGMGADHLLTCAGGAAVLARGRKEYSRLKGLASQYASERFLSDMNASLGLVQLREAESYYERRKELASVFDKAVGKSRHACLVQEGESENVHYSLPLLVETSVNEVSAFARKKGIETRLAFADSVLAFTTKDGEEADGSEQLYPIARSFMLRCILFPLYPMLGKKQAEEIAKVLSALP